MTRRCMRILEGWVCLYRTSIVHERNACWKNEETNVKPAFTFSIFILFLTLPVKANLWENIGAKSTWPSLWQWSYKSTSNVPSDIIHVSILACKPIQLVLFLPITRFTHHHVDQLQNIHSSVSAWFQGCTFPAPTQWEPPLPSLHLAYLYLEDWATGMWWSALFFVLIKIPPRRFDSETAWAGTGEPAPRLLTVLRGFCCPLCARWHR